MRSITDRIGVNMEKPKVYIDGKEGTTGLQIYERLAGRTDIELILAEEEKRKDLSERKKLINEADVVFLCLPDAAAAEAVALAENPDTRFIDASTAHRTAPGWDYGIPELPKRIVKGLLLRGGWRTQAATQQVLLRLCIL